MRQVDASKGAVPVRTIALAAIQLQAGSFDQILNYTGFTILLSSGAAVAGLFVARRHELRADSKTWLQMLAPAAFVLPCAAIVINTVWGAPKTALIGTGLILTGLPVFYWSRSKMPARAPLAVAGQESQLLHRSMPE